MAWYVTKLVVTAVLIVLISEVSKRSSLLPLLLNKGMGFYFSMGSSLAVMIGCYFVMVVVLQRYGITL